MPFRFVDLDNLPSGHPDFGSRKRMPTLVEQFYMCLTLILTGVAIVLAVHDELALTGILFTIIGLASVYVNAQTIRNRRLLQATEFENALFASTLSKGYLWCLIAKRDTGEIIYRNPEFAARFPGIGPKDTVQEWLASGTVVGDTAIHLAECLRTLAEPQVPLLIYGTNGQRESLLVSIEPIPRPAGFVLLRCRESQPTRP